jgi:hypothetical protein
LLIDGESIKYEKGKIKVKTEWKARGRKASAEGNGTIQGKI